MSLREESFGDQAVPPFFFGLLPEASSDGVGEWRVPCCRCWRRRAALRIVLRE
ncbi:hypothetical protein [Rhizobium sp. CAU 1783]